MQVHYLLDHAKEFQNRFPLSHIGGSIGLMLHGIDLQRDLSKSDIDMTCKYKLPENLPCQEYEESSSPSDFDYNFRFYKFAGASMYCKIEIRVTPEPSFTVINYNGIDYNVSLLENILFWKQKYADKGVQKHIDDLLVINGGQRPVVHEYPMSIEIDDLPF